MNLQNGLPVQNAPVVENLSWNLYTTSRAELIAMLEASGLDVQDAAPFLDFEHRVDQAINRDLIVARKPK